MTATNGTISTSDLSHLKSAGFTVPVKGADKPPRLSVLTQGKTKNGKSHWAYFTTPEPVTAIVLDPGTMPIVQKAIDAGRNILPIFINHSRKETKEEATKLWQQYRSALRAVMASKSVRTLVVDTSQEAWELARMKEFGKIDKVMGFQYTGLNAEYGGLIDELYYGRPDLNTIYIDKSKKNYVDDKWDGKSYERKGFSDLEFQVDLSITHYFKGGKFGFQIDSSTATRFGPEFSGLKFDDNECTFMDLAMTVYANHPQGSDPEYWGLKL